jgi:hypothetical protein
MLNRILILALLNFSYTIVLGHNSIPHGHFDDLFSTSHSDSHHNDSHHNNDDHHYPFSHSVGLHVAIEKQSLIAVHSVKSLLNKVSANNFCCIDYDFQSLIIPSFSTIHHNRNILFASQFYGSSLSNRGPPCFMA